jgi:hypothetical protein
MIRKSLPSGEDPMGGYRFSEKIMLKTPSAAATAYEYGSPYFIHRR